jgi:hypothetical protein
MAYHYHDGASLFDDSSSLPAALSNVFGISEMLEMVLSNLSPRALHLSQNTREFGLAIAASPSLRARLPHNYDTICMSCAPRAVDLNPLLIESYSTSASMRHAFSYASAERNSLPAFRCRLPITTDGTSIQVDHSDYTSLTTKEILEKWPGATFECAFPSLDDVDFTKLQRALRGKIGRETVTSPAMDTRTIVSFNVLENHRDKDYYERFQRVRGTIRSRAGSVKEMFLVAWAVAKEGENSVGGIMEELDYGEVIEWEGGRPDGLGQLGNKLLGDSPLYRAVGSMEEELKDADQVLVGGRQEVEYIFRGFGEDGMPIWREAVDEHQGEGLEHEHSVAEEEDVDMEEGRMKK